MTANFTNPHILVMATGLTVTCTWLAIKFINHWFHERREDNAYARCVRLNGNAPDEGPQS